jgi:hypothetical protein
MDTLYEPQNGGSMVPMSTPGFIRVGMVDSLFHKSVFSLIDNVAIIHYLKGLKRRSQYDDAPPTIHNRGFIFLTVCLWIRHQKIYRQERRGL